MSMVGLAFHVRTRFFKSGLAPLSGVYEPVRRISALERSVSLRSLIRKLERPFLGRHAYLRVTTRTCRFRGTVPSSRRVPRRTHVQTAFTRTAVPRAFILPSTKSPLVVPSPLFRLGAKVW